MKRQLLEERLSRRAVAALDILLAIILGCALALLLVSWWSS